MNNSSLYKNQPSDTGRSCAGAAASQRPLVAITMGDVNGIGPEIIAKAMARPPIRDLSVPVILGGTAAYDAARATVPHAPEPFVIAHPGDARDDTQRLAFLPSPAEPPPRRPGVLDVEAGRCAMTWLERAVDLAMAGEVDAIVTCPINKVGIHGAGYQVQGHTDFIAARTGAADYRMCLFAGAMRVVHVSAHLALRDALAMVRRDRIAGTIRIGHQALEGLALPRRRIAVAGLNPHAGEAGAFGREEIEEIQPAVETCRAEGIDCSGPYPPDTLFGRLRDGEFDMVIAMYHDQGHIPMKLIAMDEGVNVTLGIPIIRTSVDHGTAYDIAGKDLAREDSLCAAIELAAQWARMGLQKGLS